MGTRDSDITSDTYRVLAGLKYVLGTWDLESALGWSKNEVESIGYNRLSKAGTSAAFGVPTTPQPPMPAVDQLAVQPQQLVGQLAGGA